MDLINKKHQKMIRLENVNSFLKVIAGCGREFFKHKDFISYFEVSPAGKVFFIDYYTRKRIYTHHNGRWNGFTSGGTLKSLIEFLRDHIVKNTKMRISYLDPNNNYWGYEDEALMVVKKEALRLNIAE
jgi:hypothetical protein